MNTTEFLAINPRPLTGNEQITSIDNTLTDYWRWAHSNLMDNVEHGALAEYLVYTAIGAAEPTRVNWDRYDVKSPEGITIEVKASGYIQSWPQKRLSNINFFIRPTYGWGSEANTYASKCTRQSDVYVFCMLSHKEQATINPLDTVR